MHPLCKATKSRKPPKAAQPAHAILAQSLLSWFTRHARDLPWRRTLDPYAIWVSEIMLQQTQVQTVIPYWERWMRALPSVQALAKAKPEKVLKLWEGLGYYTRARNLQRAAKMIWEENGGTFPERFEEVLALPGIGRYTAGAICSIAYNQPTPVLDGNVIRVLCRIFGIEANAKEKETQSRLWAIAESLVVEASKAKPFTDALPHVGNAGNCSRLNQSLMELGAIVCTPRGPACSKCPVTGLCVAHKTNRADALPNLGPAVRATPRRFVAFVVENRGRFLVRQRPHGVVNAQLWEFPNVEVTAEEDLNAVAKRLFMTRASKLEPLCTIRHTITRYRITLEVYRTRVDRAALGKTGAWAGISELKRLPFSSAHRKILSILARA